MKRRTRDEDSDIPERLLRFAFEDWAELIDRTVPEHYDNRSYDPDRGLLFGIRAHRLWSEARRDYQASHGWPAGTLQRILVEADAKRAIMGHR